MPIPASTELSAVSRARPSAHVVPTSARNYDKLYASLAFLSVLGGVFLGKGYFLVSTFELSSPEQRRNLLAELARSADTRSLQILYAHFYGRSVCEDWNTCCSAVVNAPDMQDADRIKVLNYLSEIGISLTEADERKLRVRSPRLSDWVRAQQDRVESQK